MWQKVGVGRQICLQVEICRHSRKARRGNRREQAHLSASKYIHTHLVVGNWGEMR